ncbi:Argininosuccinate lyase [Balamuthia mandrillaris]
MEEKSSSSQSGAEAQAQGQEKKKKLWQTSTQLHPLVEAFTVGDDHHLDSKLLEYDLQASSAHASMLASIQVLSEEELSTLQKALEEIKQLHKEGKFEITRAQEDGHTAIEQYITEHYGEVGKKIHTGRSRNDQSLVMLRLYAKDKLKEIISLTERLVTTFQHAAQQHATTEMPGYTHMQRAMPTTVGVWLDSFACALQDSLLCLRSTLTLIDQNPLGSAAGFGIRHLPLDRAMTAREMGFERVQENVMYCGFSRGFFEWIMMQALAVILTVTSRFAVDMMGFTQQETAFFALPDEFVTGSSIMPQKKNYDLFEIMRGNGKVFASYQAQMQGIILGLGSGYHRDLQLTKKPFVEGVELCTSTLELLLDVVPALRVNKERLRGAMTKDLYLTDEVYKRVASGVPFREAYQLVKNEFFSAAASSALSE